MESSYLIVSRRVFKNKKEVCKWFRSGTIYGWTHEHTFSDNEISDFVVVSSMNLTDEVLLAYSLYPWDVDQVVDEVSFIDLTDNYSSEILKNNACYFAEMGDGVIDVHV